MAFVRFSRNERQKERKEGQREKKGRGKRKEADEKGTKKRNNENERKRKAMTYLRNDKGIKNKQTTKMQREDK